MILSLSLNLSLSLSFLQSAESHASVVCRFFKKAEEKERKKNRECEPDRAPDSWAGTGYARAAGLPRGRVKPL